MKQVLIAIDQVLNTLVWAEDEGFGMADETLSARAWRLRSRYETWGRFMTVVDTLFWTQTDEQGIQNHCKASYERERDRKQLPYEYRT